MARQAAEPLPRLLPWLLLVGGLTGLAAAFTLTVEKIALLTDDTYVPSCNINPVLSCGSIMRTSQAEVFGFPNPLIGLIGFSVVAATGAALLGGARLGRGYWLGLQAGVTFGIGFVAWLIFQSLFRINALCPYCMVVWAVVIPIFWYVTLTNAATGRLGPSVQRHRAVQLVTRNHGILLTLMSCLLIALITYRVWELTEHSYHFGR